MKRIGKSDIKIPITSTQMSLNIFTTVTVTSQYFKPLLDTKIYRVCYPQLFNP